MVDGRDGLIESRIDGPLSPRKNRRHPWNLSSIFCCCRCAPINVAERGSAAMDAPSSSNTGGLPEDVYRQIRAVDQATSTLTRGAILGLSARVLDKSEFRSPQTGEVYVVQLVEIIKKPGQSLGLFLREGNGIDRGSGVFASRLAEQSELTKCDDLIRPGDEILSINNVEVANMSIDDVVLILSIPRRLLLRIRFNKNRRERGASSRQPADRPVVVFHKYEERPPGEPAPCSLLSQPTSTADTWLGKRARQQSQEMQRSGIGTTIGGGGVGPQSPYGSAYSSSGVNMRAGMSLPNGDLVGRSQRFSDPDPLDTVSRTARVIPSKICSTSMRRADSFGTQPIQSVGLTLPRSSTAVPPPDPLRDTIDPLRDPREPLSAREPLMRSGCSPVMPRSARQPLPTATYDTRSNSLPRRRAISGPRNVKWRPDVVTDLGEESDGATSAPEFGGYSTRYSNPLRLANGGAAVGRTVNELFSGGEHRHWADLRQQQYLQANYPNPQIYAGQNYQNVQLTTPGYALPPMGVPIVGGRWSQPADLRGGTRSCSLPSRSLVTSSLVGSPQPMRREPNVLDRYHVSPLMNRRAPLRPAGPGINVDRLNVNSLTGILFVQILEGRGLKIPDKQRAVTEEMYCVLEVDECHRARTGVSTSEQRYRWRETFHIDVHNATITHFFIYSWHPQYRHKLCHKGSLKLLEAFVVDQLNGDRIFALSLEPRGQLIVRIGFHDMDTVFRRQVNTRSDAAFGVPLSRLVQRERRETPVVLSRLIQELERRGVDYTGLYILCGSVEKKRVLRDELECSPFGTDLGIDSVPDTNVLACLIKDFLRELPEPLVPLQIHSMLLDAAAVMRPNDVQDTRNLVLSVIDCLPTPNKNTLIMVMDHLMLCLTSSPHNGLSQTRLATIFAPLLLCTTDPPPIQPSYSATGGPKELVRPLDVTQASATLQLLFDLWPSRVNGDSSSGSSATPTRALAAAYAALAAESKC
ncbi:unnamed protein product, partial [Mesorhabditis belari]|uniref:Rho GTPase-activating protein 100F n=1 Tax=Mesorhabditis belari TaxID=2138241 RepID=A0AAF3J625_9BILA